MQFLRGTFSRQEFQNQPPKDGSYIADITFIKNTFEKSYSRCQVRLEQDGIIIPADCTPHSFSLARAQVHVDF